LLNKEKKNPSDLVLINARSPNQWTVYSGGGVGLQSYLVDNPIHAIEREREATASCNQSQQQKNPEKKR
jgi:hypothetical protein